MPEVNIPGVGIVHFPYDMPPEQIAAQAQRLYAEAQGKEAPLTRERRPAGAPSALAEPRREIFGKPVPTLKETLAAETPSDAAFLKRAPEVGLVVGGALGGPLGSGLGAAAGRMVKGQHEQGAHVPSAGEFAGAAGEGLLTTALGAGPRLAQVGARAAGPAIVKNAAKIGRAAQTVAGGGFGASVMSGNVPAMLTTGATALATSPGALRGMGSLATRAGSSPAVETIADWLGRGARALAPGAEAYRQALLDALAEDSPASTVP